jgi:hypothetical protein
MSFVGLGVFILLVIPEQIEKPLIIFGQSLNTLDPTLFPSIVAWGFILLGSWGVYGSFSIDETNDLTRLDQEAWFNVGITVVAMLAYAGLMVPLGFIPSSIILIAALSSFYGIRSIGLLAVISIGVPTSIYFIFTRGLKVFLPEIPWL